MTTKEIADLMQQYTQPMSRFQVRAAINDATRSRTQAASNQNAPLGPNAIGRNASVGARGASFDSRIIDTMPEKIRTNPQAMRDYLIQNGLDQEVATNATKMLNNSASRAKLNRNIIADYLANKNMDASGATVSEVMDEMNAGRRLARGAGKGLGRQGRKTLLSALMGTVGSSVLSASPLDMMLEAQPLGNGELPGVEVIPRSGDEAIADIIGPRPMFDEEGKPIPTINANPYAR